MDTHSSPRKKSFEAQRFETHRYLPIFCAKQFPLIDFSGVLPFKYFKSDFPDNYGRKSHHFNFNCNLADKPF
jgi:hypothetical protein